ncbi:MAG: hypothetical protein OHK0056_26680 [Bacteriovoracaceae bacterium]
MSTITNQKGSALVILLVASLAIALLGMHIMQLTKQMESVNHHDQKQLAHIQFTNGLRKILENPGRCTNALQGKDIEDAFSPDGLDILPFAEKYAGQDVIFQSNWRSPEGAILDRIVLNVDPTVVRNNIRRDIPSSPVLTAFNATLTVFSKEGTPSMKSGKHDYLKIEIMLYSRVVGGKRNLYSCFGKYGDGALCTISGGAYNTGAVLSGRAACEPDENCFVSKVGLVTNPSLCISPFTPFEIAAGMYECHWCNQN